MASGSVVVATPSGAGHIVLTVPRFTPAAGSRPAALVVLGHGASGDSEAADILAVRDALTAVRCVVVRTIQPYRVAGRRVPAPVAQLDVAFAALVAAARTYVPVDTPLVVGGRSNGARVAARTALGLGAAALLALSFPLRPPRRPEVSRAGELQGAGVPALVLQGERDQFGTPGELAAAVDGTEVHRIQGAGHSPKPGAALAAAAELAAAWVISQVGD